VRPSEDANVRFSEIAKSFLKGRLSGRRFRGRVAQVAVLHPYYANVTITYPDCRGNTKKAHGARTPSLPREIKS